MVNKTTKQTWCKLLSENIHAHINDSTFDYTIDFKRAIEWQIFLQSTIIPLCQKVLKLYIKPFNNYTVTWDILDSC